jgi:hypothetical protein
MKIWKRLAAPSGYAGILCIACLVVFWVERKAQYRFAGYDLSPAIDAGWRLMQGQVPGRDFICTFPPSLTLAVFLGYRLFGINFQSLIHTACLLYAALLLLGMRVAWKLGSVAGRARALWVAFIYCASLSVPLLVVNHVWHSSIAQQFSVYALLTTAAIVSGHRGPRRLDAAELWLNLVIAFAGLLLSKPNTAYTTLVLCAAALVLAKQRWRYLGSALLGSLVVASAILVPFRMSVFSMWAGYAGLQGRLVPKPLITGLLIGRSFMGGGEALIAYLCGAMLATLILSLLWKHRLGLRENSLLFLAGSGLLVTVAGMSTNFELKIVDLPTLLMGSALLPLAIADERRLAFARTSALAVTLLLIASFYAEIRLRMITTGMWANDAYGGMLPVGDTFFGPLQAAQALRSILADSDAIVAARPGERIFFGPRLEFLYARDHLPSPLHLPLWWHTGTSFPAGWETNVNRAWEGDRFDVLIFYRNAEDDGRLLMTPQVQADVTSQFRELPGTSAIQVFVRK